MMGYLRVILAVVFMATLPSVYGGSCFEKPFDVDDCREKAEQGLPEAQAMLAGMYDVGHGVTQDYKESAKWMQLAAEQGNSHAQYQLGIRYHDGIGVTQDYKESVKWLRLAAEQGSSDAQYDLGIMYHDGTGVTQDYKESAKWLQLAVEQGHTEAPYKLALHYVMVENDLIMAHIFFNIASNYGNKEALKFRDMMTDALSAQELQKAQDLAREWMRKH
jgi:uncharacterized protein